MSGRLQSPRSAALWYVTSRRYLNNGRFRWSVCRFCHRFLNWKTALKAIWKVITSDAESLRYDFMLLKKSTNDFSKENELGVGGFGFVYKGKLENGRLIAIKRLRRDSKQGSHEFKKEVELLANLNHRNLVHLVGYCIEGIERMLVYDFLEHGSLESYIHDSSNKSFLDWEKWRNIIIDVAIGLEYLHENAYQMVVHRDIKPPNILLDKNLKAKTRDFGLAKMSETAQLSINGLTGTYGYIAPECNHSRYATAKMDVFSFGVVMLEIITGKRPVTEVAEEKHLNDIVYKHWQRSEARAIIDPVLTTQPTTTKGIIRYMHIAFLCPQYDP